MEKPTVNRIYSRGAQLARTRRSVLGFVVVAVVAAVGSLMLVYAQQPAGATFPGQNGKIVFSAGSNTGISLFTINPDDSGRTKIYTRPRYPDGPAWSPNGTKIAFTGVMNGNDDIYVINADGSGLKRITKSPAIDLNPAWSPNGKRIAFTRRSKSAGTTVSGTAVYKIRVDRTGLRRLSGDMRVALVPAWSPSGGKIAFVGSRGPGAWDLFKMDATDGTNKRALTNSSSISEVDPNWSPDGTKIVYSYIYPSASGGQYLRTMNADGTNRNGLGQRGLEPSWSPDGTKIASEYGSKIRIMNSDGTGAVETLTTTRADVDALDWQPLH